MAKSGHSLTVSVNVAVSQLDDEFVGRVAQQLEASDLPPETLCLELTESALCETLGSRADALTVLRAMGVHTAVDDFGTGYSSLSYFQHFPFDTLKIDRSFIEPLGADDGRAAALVDAITSMARALDLHVVGEGVETAEQLAAARGLGVRYVQGFLLSKPLEAGELRGARPPPARGAGDARAAAADVAPQPRLVGRRHTDRVGVGDVPGCVDPRCERVVGRDHGFDVVDVAHEVVGGAVGRRFDLRSEVQAGRSDRGRARRAEPGRAMRSAAALQSSSVQPR